MGVMIVMPGMTEDILPHSFERPRVQMLWISSEIANVKREKGKKERAETSTCAGMSFSFGASFAAPLVGGTAVIYPPPFKAVTRIEVDLHFKILTAG